MVTLEERHQALKPRNFIHSPEFLKNKTFFFNFMGFMGTFMSFNRYLCQKECKCCRNLSSYPNLRPIFSAVRKNIFSKMVTLLQEIRFQSPDFLLHKYVNYF